MGLQQYTQGKVLPEPDCGANMNALLTEIIAKHATKSSIDIKPLLNEEHDGSPPERVTTDGHASYPRAVRETLGNQVQHRTNKYLNNCLEQDHRGIKQGYYPMHGFGNARLSSPFLFCL